jgi:predicted aspartyl protease
MFLVLRVGLLFALCFARFAAGQSTDSESSATPPAESTARAAARGGQSSPPQNPAAGTPAAISVTVKSDAPTSSPLRDALALYRRGKLTAAIEKYQQVLRTTPASPDAYAGLTRTYLKQGNVSLASETAAKGLTLSDSPHLRVALAEVYFRQGKILEAEQEWVRIINSGNLEARAYLGVSRIRNAISMYKQGKLMIDKAHELDPTDPDIENSWIATLPLSERVQHLQSYLANTDSDSAEDRAGTQRYLDYLKALANQRGRRCRLVSNVTSTETPLVRLLLDPTHLRGYGLTVNVNGHKSNLMLDTGASGILIDRGTADKAGITKLSETRIGGIGDKGDKSGYVGLANSIKIGELEFQNCPVEVLEKRSVVGEAGLIGADVFKDFLVNLDFPREKLRLSALPKRPGDDSSSAGTVALHSEEDSVASADDADTAQATNAEKQPAPAASSRFHDLYIAPEMKSYTRVYRFGHLLLIPTRVGNAPIKFFLLDTGALTNHITPAAAREITKVRGDSDTIVTGISGAVNKVYSADKAILQFGHLRQENQDLIAFDLTSVSESAGTEISGTLGFTLLRLLNIKIDYRDGLVDFEYKPSY